MIGDYLILTATGVYAIAVAAYIWQGCYPLALLYSCICGANVATIWLAHWRVK